MIDLNKIAEKWQKKWRSSDIFKTKQDKKKKKYFVLEMYPYPSSAFLHVGHVRNYTIGDVIARFRRMQGFNVLYPMGYDSFGLPAEQAAEKEGIHPKIYTENAIKKIIEYQKALGNSYDWNRIITTHDPKYYKWNQYFFLKFLENDLAYRKKSPVNWCPDCNSTLADEEVINGKCWRHENTEVETRETYQWFFKITAYADEILKDLDKLEWSDRIKNLQRNWIGKSDGMLFHSPVKDTDLVIETFSTHFEAFKADTFVAIAPDHPFLPKLLEGVKNKNEILDFCQKIIKKRQTQKEPEIEGMFTGRYTLDPVGNGELPIWVASFALKDYGTGIVKCSAHDKRDFEFAKKYSIKLKTVLLPEDPKLRKKVENFEICYSDMKNGILTEPKKFAGKRLVREEIIKYIIKNKLAKKVTQYKIRNWLISRQRYWGTPIPIIYCNKCGIVPLSEKDLPILLPEKVDFSKEGNPLANVKEWVNVKCPKCKSSAKRETDTMSTFMDSSWYFLRFCSPNHDKAPFDKKEVSYWMPVDQYIGGIEHAVGHLIYSRFMVKALRDLKMLNLNEPFTRLFNQGIVYKDGHKMSKSFGNIVYQTDISEKYGIDTARLFLMSVASPDSDMEWSDNGVEGSFRFLQRVSKISELRFKKPTPKDEHKRNITIKNFTALLESFKFNLAVIELIKYTDYLIKNPTKNGYEDLLKMLSLFAPHLAEELWENIGNKKFISVEKWLIVNEKLIDLELEIEEKIIENAINDIKSLLALIKIKPAEIKIFIADKWKYQVFKKLKSEKSKNFSEVFNKIRDKVHDSEIRNIVERFIKGNLDLSIILDQDKEFKIFEENKGFFEKQFNLKFSVEKSENTNESKARQALPGKPAILVK